MVPFCIKCQIIKIAYNLKNKPEDINVYEGVKTVNGKKKPHPKLKGIGCELPIIKHGSVIHSGYRDIINYIDPKLFPDLRPVTVCDEPLFPEFDQKGEPHRF